jgi:hypothetical protein
MREAAQWFKIVGFCVVAAIGYGIGHDLVTVQLCLEYFTIGHPPIFGGTENRVVLALGWGVIATWWVGVILGLPGAFFARVGLKPKLGWREFRKPVLILRSIRAISAGAAGLFSAFVTGPTAEYYFPDQWNTKRNCVVAASMHQMSYVVGFVGGVVTWGWIWRRRCNMSM